MLPGLLAGIGLGLGCWLVARGLRPAARPLAVTLAELERPRWGAVPVSRRGWSGRVRAAAMALVESSGRDLGPLHRDLALVERTIERHAVDKLTMATLGAVLPVGFALTITAGGVAAPPLMVAVGCTAGAVGGFFYPDVALRSEAASRRREFRRALGAFLDLVTIILAGGGGVESALDTASRTGDGWAFARLRQAIAVSRLNRESPWVVLNRMAEELGVTELAELASSIGLAGDSGAKVRQSLGAKAASMRAHELAEAQAAAETATERMSAPVVAMLTGFIILIGYPAVANVLTL